MKTLKEYIVESQISESIVADILIAKRISELSDNALGTVSGIIKKIKSNISKNKEYTKAVNTLNDLLSPHKKELMKTEWGSKLYSKEGLITGKQLEDIKNNSENASRLYNKLFNDIRNVLSDDELTKYEDILAAIKIKLFS